MKRISILLGVLVWGRMVRDAASTCLPFSPGVGAGQRIELLPPARGTCDITLRVRNVLNPKLTNIM